MYSAKQFSEDEKVIANVLPSGRARRLANSVESNLSQFLSTSSFWVSYAMVSKVDGQLIMPSNENLTIYKRSGSLVPYPGDRICPSTA